MNNPRVYTLLAISARLSNGFLPQDPITRLPLKFPGHFDSVLNGICFSPRDFPASLPKHRVLVAQKNGEFFWAWESELFIAPLRRRQLVATHTASLT